MDIFTKSKRRAIMRSVRRTHTKPELLIANLLSAAGIVFTQHHTSLPGKPDFVFPSHNIVLFVHGCFWHGHERCPKGRSLTRSNRAYWQLKIMRNRRRDRRISDRLRKMGYRVFTVWECELKRNKVLPSRLTTVLLP